MVFLNFFAVFLTALICVDVEATRFSSSTRSQILLKRNFLNDGQATETNGESSAFTSTNAPAATPEPFIFGSSSTTKPKSTAFSSDFEFKSNTPFRAAESYNAIRMSSFAGKSEFPSFSVSENSRQSRLKEKPHLWASAAELNDKRDKFPASRLLEECKDFDFTAPLSKSDFETLGHCITVGNINIIGNKNEETTRVVFPPTIREVHGNILLANGTFDSLVLPNVESIFGDLVISESATIGFLDFPNLLTSKTLNIVLNKPIRANIPQLYSVNGDVIIRSTFESTTGSESMFALPTLEMVSAFVSINNTEFYAPELKTVGGAIMIHNAPKAFLNVDFPMLRQVNSIIIEDNANTESIFMPNVDKLDGSLVLRGNQKLQNLDLASLEKIGGNVFLIACPLLWPSKKGLSMEKFQEVGGIMHLGLQANTNLDDQYAFKSNFPKLKVGGDVIFESKDVIDSSLVESVFEKLNLEDNNTGFRLNIERPFPIEPFEPVEKKKDVTSESDPESTTSSNKDSEQVYTEALAPANSESKSMSIYALSSIAIVVPVYILFY